MNYTVSCNLPCNPALADSFPWLAGHAKLFENYRIHNIVYRYKTLKGTSTNGNVIMSFDYDTLDSAPTTAILQTQSTIYIDGAPWKTIEMRVPSPKRNLFTRQGAIVGADLKTYDFGRLFIATEGCSDTSEHGYVEVEYDIELLNKQSGSSSVGTVTSTAYYTDAGGISCGFAVPIPFATVVKNDIGIVNAAGVFTLPTATWLITANVATAATLLCSFRVDGVATGAYTKAAAGYDSSAIFTVVSDGTTTVELTPNVTTTTTAGLCRLMFQAL